MIAIIDYGAGNLVSVKNALDYLGVASKITSKAEDIEKAERIIFPGVGSFGFMIESLRKLKLEEPLKKALSSGKPYLGICLGHQLLADSLGAKVGNNFTPSIGFIDGHLTRDGREHPIFKDIPKIMPLFKWHGQAVQPPLPKHLHVLATSSQCEVEAIGLEDRPHIIGLQFDNHAADPTRG